MTDTTSLHVTETLEEQAAGLWAGSLAMATRLQAAYASPQCRKIQLRGWGWRQQLALALLGVEAYARPIRSGDVVRWQLTYRATDPCDALMALADPFLLPRGGTCLRASDAVAAWRNPAIANNR